MGQDTGMGQAVSVRKITLTHMYESAIVKPTEIIQLRL